MSQHVHTSQSIGYVQAQHPSLHSHSRIHTSELMHTMCTTSTSKQSGIPEFILILWWQKVISYSLGGWGGEREGVELEPGRVTKMQPFLICHHAITRMITRHFSAPL